ncbi:flavin-containing monooxygenase [Nakamurella leprariae]|uniref:NAD(P)/FAD-dependent oxidoreductase n=1 Tax=Nakamurella leprariae TaxID=2803911 RepID=A0A938YAC9_9ACTN|nr:NAD(P)/FAD-dependent oxidoreductase [Nakamurella leprariae]MBM9465951.1 NAD(P)/FAD-dependent oxidoreductase [Nakamurella leprariae]
MTDPDHVHDALIIGAGYGGLGMGAQFARTGIEDFVILERSGDLGGVWRDNTYPGAACDTQAVVYCYSFFPHLDLSRMFVEGPELLGYLRDFASHFDLTRRIAFGQEVVSAEWMEDRRSWRVLTSAGDEYLARVLVPAWGQLSTPAVPRFEGLDRFAGAAFHSARWNHAVPLTGRRVASIGAAASAVQYVPFVARDAAQLTVFQRSANYILPRNQRIFTDEERARFREDPATFEALRREVHAFREAGFARVRHRTEEQATGVAEARAHLEAQIADPDLRRKLTPDHEFGCKRILRTDDYYPALARPNVQLVTEAIDHFTPDGLVTADGTTHGFDVVIFGTGFHSQSFQGDTRITGRGGVSLAERWGDAPEAHLGLTVDGFPNLFLVYGPNTNLNHNSVVSMMEIQHEFIVEATRRITDAEVVYDVPSETVRQYNDLVQQRLIGSAFSADCSSWYKNAAGRVVNNWYGTVEEYRRAVHGMAAASFWTEPAATVGVPS